MDGPSIRRYQVRKHQVIGGCTLCCLLAPVRGPVTIKISGVCIIQNVWSILSQVIVLFILVGWPAGVISTSVYLCVFALLIHYLRKPVSVIEVYEPAGSSYQQAPPAYSAGYGSRMAHDTAVLV